MAANSWRTYPGATITYPSKNGEAPFAFIVKATHTAIKQQIGEFFVVTNNTNLQTSKFDAVNGGYAYMAVTYADDTTATFTIQLYAATSSSTYLNGGAEIAPLYASDINFP